MPALLVVQDGLANTMNWQPWSIYKGLTWAYTDAWERHVYSHLLPPNAPPVDDLLHQHVPLLRGGQRHEPDQQPSRRRQRLVHGRLGPLHQEHVNLQAWWSMGTRGRGEIISADSYDRGPGRGGTIEPVPRLSPGSGVPHEKRILTVALAAALLGRPAAGGSPGVRQGRPVHARVAGPGAGLPLQ